MKEKNQPLSELAGIMTKYPQVLINVRVATKTGWEDNDIIKAAIVTAEGELAMKVAFQFVHLVQNPLIRVMAEGPDQEALQALVPKKSILLAENKGQRNKVG